MGKNRQNDPTKVHPGRLIAWQMRPISLGSVTIIIGYLSLYCTNVLKMDPMLVGTILMVSKLFDGVTDLIAGYLVDNTHTRWGKGRPYEFSIIGVWICMYALFGASVEWSITAKCIWVFVMYTLVFSIFSTLLNAAEGPYIIRAFGNKEAITKVSAYGGILISIGCMIVSISFPMFVSTMGTTTAGWRKLMAMYAIPLVLIGIIRFLFVKEECAVYGNDNDPVRMKDIFTVLKTNKYVWIFAIACAIPQLLMGMSAATYYFTDVVGDLGKYSTIQACSMLTLFVMIIFPVLMKKYSGMQIMGGCALIGLVGYVINFFAGANMPLLVIGFILSGISPLPASYMRTPIVMQLADYNVSRNSPRMEAVMGSVVNFLIKVGSAFGSFLMGVMLSVGGYIGGAASQTEEALMMVRLSYSLVPAAFMVLIVISTVLFRPLDKITK